MTWAPGATRAGTSRSGRCPGRRSGRHFVAARIADGGQVFEDAVLVSVGEPAAPALDLPLNELFPLYVADQQKLAAELDLALLTPQLRLRPGERGEIAVRLGNTTAAQIRGEAQLVSPFGSWAEARPVDAGFRRRTGRRTHPGLHGHGARRRRVPGSTGGRWSR